MILHIATRVEWEEANAAGTYRSDALDSNGFIHCSTREQVLGPADAIFRGWRGLVLLCIEAAKVEATIVYEDLNGESQNYPHIYGPLNIPAVFAVVDFPSNADGSFSLPADLPSSPPTIVVRAKTEQDTAWATDFLTEHAGSPRQVARGHVHQADELPGYMAFDGDERVGLATYVNRGDECEVATLHAATQYHGVGTALLQAVRAHAEEQSCRRLWLVTTNDNVDALRFYQRRGFRLVAVHAGAVDDARATLKPEIPETGDYRIPLRDELELELWID